MISVSERMRKCTIKQLMVSALIILILIQLYFVSIENINTNTRNTTQLFNNYTAINPAIHDEDEIECKLDKTWKYPPFINAKYVNRISSEYKLLYNDYTECMNVVCRTPYNYKNGVNWEFNNPSIWNDTIRWYQLPNIKNDEVKIIIEIGCNIGFDSIKLLNKYPNAILFCFEPLKILHEEKLNKIISQFNDRYVVYFKGISFKHNEIMRFYKERTDKIGLSVTLWNDEDLNKIDNEKYEIFNATTIKPSIMINKIIGNNSDIYIDILHMNCEGCEAIVISDLINTNIIHKIKNIVMGTHCYEWLKPSPQHVWCTNHINLKKNGYLPIEKPRPCSWERWQKY